MARRNLDLQRVRKDYNVTQQRLAELTKYPQSFISQIENARVPVPEAFITALVNVLGIPDIEPYLIPTAEEKAVLEAQSEAESRASEQQTTINRLLDMLERRDERIKSLEDELKRCHELLLKKVEQ